ncbi:MAG: hypothetical protein RL172_2769 [Bacteroidota bacterium]
MKQITLFNEKRIDQVPGEKHSIALRASILMLVLLGFTTLANAQTTITAVQDGAWNDPNTWDAGIPTAADDAIIGNGLTVSIEATGAVCNNLTIGTGDETSSGAILFVGTSGLTVTDNITLGDIAGATGTITMDAAASLTCGRVTEGDPGFSGIYETNFGTITFTGTFTLPYNLFQFNNLVITSGTVSTGGRNLPIEGDLTISNTGTLDLKENTANRNTIAGTLSIINSATLRIGGGGTIPANFNTHVISSTSTIEYYGVSQTVATLNSSQNYGNLVIAGSGLKEVNGSIGVAGNLTVSAAIFSVNTFTANRTSAGGTLTVANGATLRIAGNGTLPSNYSTHVIGATSTIEYSGTSAQSIATLNSSQKYGNLNAYSSVKTLAGSITVNGTLAFSGTPCKVVIGSNTLTLEGPVSGGTSSRNFTCSASSNMVVTGAYNRTLYFDATTAGTTNALNNLTLNHTGNITTLGNDLTVNGNLTFTQGKLAISSRTLTLKGTFVHTVSGGLRGGSSSNLTINTTTSPNLSMDQTTAGTTNALNNFIINSNNQVITMDNDLQVNGTTTFTAGKLSINGNTLTLKGLVTNTSSGGIRAGSTSNLVINGTVSPSLSFDQTTAGTTNALNNFTINSSGQTVTLTNALRLTGTHTPTAGVLAAGGYYTIASTESSTANIAAGSTSGGYITGSVIVERYIPQNSYRAWRLLAAPTNGQTIKEAWQENQAAGVNGNPGYGTNITSNLAAPNWSANGFDFYTPNNSMLSYDENNDELVGVTSTATGIANEPGYFIYIRGSRSVSPSSSIASVNATTLRSTGTLNTGNQSAITVQADKFKLIGNPYASAIDLRNVATSGGCVGTAFYVWDPKLPGSYNLGAYQTLTQVNGDYIIVPGGGSYGNSGSISNNIQSGAAFFAEAIGSSGTITIAESSKTSGSSMVFRPLGTTPVKSIISKLYAITANGTQVADGNILLFSPEYNNSIDAADGRKMNNFGENLGMLKAGNVLAMEKRILPSQDDTVHYTLSRLKKISYQITLLPNNMGDAGMQMFLEDKFLNSSVPVSLTDSTTYTFTITNDAASAATDRLKLVLKPFQVLPVTITGIKAYQQAQQITVEWHTSNEVNMQQYIVEKSADGSSFNTAGSIKATGNTMYQWIDAVATAGVHYYRVKLLSNGGQFSYTPIVKVTIGKQPAAVTVSPNPVKGNTMHLQMVNQPAGNYHIRLSNINGQVLYKAQLRHYGGSASQTVNLPAQTTSGIYQLEIIMPDNSHNNQRIIIKADE